MKKYITIGREFGSKGKEIAKLVSEKLNIPYYDSEIIDLAAKDSGLSAEFIKENEQKITSGWLYTLLLGSGYSVPGSSGRLNINTQSQTAPLADQVFNAQRNTIIELAKKGPCVFLGRCSDYILRHCEEISREDLLNVFIYADLNFKVKTAIEEGMDPQTAEREVKLIDKRRANHYNTFTERTWGKRDHYDLLLSSSSLGVETAAQIIAEVSSK